MKLAIITTHPIQYNAPLFRLLAQQEQIHPKVFYTWGEGGYKKKYDPDFKQTVEWDIDLLSGYESIFVPNISTHPGSSHYQGINNPSLIGMVQQWQPTAILVYGWNFKSHFKLMRYFKNRIPIFFRGDSILQANQAWHKKLARRVVLTFVYKFIDAALYAGQANKKYFLHAGVLEKNLFFAPHAVDNNFFAQPITGTNARQQLNIPDHVVLFLFTGKLVANKNIDTLLKAFGAVKPGTAHLIIVGDGPQMAALQNSTTAQTNVHFLGFKNQNALPAIYQAADVFVLPSYNETWGLSANEAMAAGCAILMSDQCGAAQDLVSAAVNGFTFSPNNLQQLSQYMQQMAEQPASTKRMGIESRKIIANFTYTHTVKAIHKLMQQYV